MPARPAASAPHPAPSRQEWTAAIVLAVNLGWTLWHFGGYQPGDRLVSLWLTALATVTLLSSRTSRGSVGWHPAGYLLLPFAALATVNVMAVTPVKWLGWMDLWGWLQLAVTVWLACNLCGHPPIRRFLTGSLGGLLVLECAMACYQAWVDPLWLPLDHTQSVAFLGRSSGTFGIPNSLAGFALLVIPPVLAGLARHPRSLMRWLVAGCGAYALFLTTSRGAWFALVLALACWPLFDPAKAWRRRFAWAGAILAGALFVLAALYALSPGVRDRLTALARDGGERTRPAMWAGAWRLFLDAPLFGTGAGSYNVLFERHRPAGYRDEPQWAHNEWLNTLSDHGAVGFALAFVLPAAALMRARRMSSRRSPASAEERAWGVGLLGFGITLALDFHLKLPALAMAAAIAFASWCTRWTQGPRTGPPPVDSVVRSLLVLGALLGVLLTMMFLVAPSLRAEALRYDSRRSIDAWAHRGSAGYDVPALLARARERLAEAIVVDEANAQAWADLSYVLSLLAREDPGATGRLGVEAESAARQALARAEPVPEFWWRLGVALDMQGRWLEAGAAFARAIELAPHHPLGWYYQAYHYSLNPATRALALPSLATCLRLDPGYAPAESLWESLKAAP